MSLGKLLLRGESLVRNPMPAREEEATACTLSAWPQGVCCPSLIPMLGLGAGSSGLDQCSGSERPVVFSKSFLASYTSSEIPICKLGTVIPTPHGGMNRHEVRQVKAEVRQKPWVTLYPSPSQCRWLCFLCPSVFLIRALGTFCTLTFSRVLKCPPLLP